MAGIALPVLLHLWNNKQGKVLHIGSIALLEKGSRRQARSRRLSEWWLLLLRCLLLLLLALLLSGPFWRNSSKGVKAKGWILGVKEDALTPAYKPLIDSLLKAGYERHEWGNGASPSPSYWDLFRAADNEAPAGIPFFIFTSGRRSGFTGKRPVSDRIVYWFIGTPSTDAASQWIEQAWLYSPDSIQVVTGNSRSTGTSYSFQLLPVKAAIHPDPETYHIGLTNGHLSVALDSQPPVTVDTTALRVWIYIDDKYTNDSRYLVAALHALQQFTRRHIQVTVGGGISSPKPSADWIFWLSAVPVPSDPSGLPVPNIVCYEPGREISVDTWMQGITGVAVSRRIEPDSASGATVLWKDGFGHPLLSLETSSGRRIFHFFSHFDPAWNGLVWSPRFPVLLQELLDNPASFAGSDFNGSVASARESPRFASLGGHDLRVLDPEQVVPQTGLAGTSDHPREETAGFPDGSSVSAQSGIPLHATDLASACWLLIFLLFVAERILSFRSPKIRTDG